MTQSEVSSDEALAALHEVLASEALAGSDRLKQFLDYVVREAVDGRGDLILGKRIAQDVYNRRTHEGDAPVNAVRVDAGRLRQRLDTYYRTEGQNNRVRIDIEKGGYTPRFSYIPDRAVEAPFSDQVAVAPQIEQRPKSSMIVYGTLVLCAAALIALAVSSVNKNTAGNVPIEQNADEQAKREALFETSPGALQALNLAEEARTMMFPATQPARLRAALALFQEAMELDPTYYGGYAGAAQTSAIFGGLAPLGTERDMMMEKARQLAEHAVKLDPTSAWGQSALALVNMFERDFDEANRLSLRAVALDPDDLATLEFDAIIAFFSGDFERARSNAAPRLHQNRSQARSPWQSVYGNALFYLEDYEQSAEVLLSAARNGAPVSEISSAHLIASLYASGKEDEARRYLGEYVVTWPESRLRELMLRLFQDPAHARKLILQMQNAGWTG